MFGVGKRKNEFTLIHTRTNLISCCSWPIERFWELELVSEFQLISAVRGCAASGAVAHPSCTARQVVVSNSDFDSNWRIQASICLTN